MIKLTHVLGTALIATVLLAGPAMADSNKSGKHNAQSNNQGEQRGNHDDGNHDGDDHGGRPESRVAAWTVKAEAKTTKSSEEKVKAEAKTAKAAEEKAKSEANKAAEDKAKSEAKKAKTAEEKAQAEAKRAAAEAYKKQVLETVKPSLVAYHNAKEGTRTVTDLLKEQATLTKETAKQVKEAIKDDPISQEALTQELAPLKEEANGLKTQWEALRAELKASWDSFRTARKSKDVEGMKAAVDQATTQRQEMNGILGQFLTLLQQKLAVLNQYK